MALTGSWLFAMAENAHQFAMKAIEMKEKIRRRCAQRPVVYLPLVLWQLELVVY
jgi:hypothetical protein